MYVRMHTGYAQEAVVNGRSQGRGRRRDQKPDRGIGGPQQLPVPGPARPVVRGGHAVGERGARPRRDARAGVHPPEADVQERVEGGGCHGDCPARV